MNKTYPVIPCKTSELLSLSTLFVPFYGLLPLLGDNDNLPKRCSELPLNSLNCSELENGYYPRWFRASQQTHTHLKSNKDLYYLLIALSISLLMQKLKRETNAGERRIT